MARRLADGVLVDPFGGRDDLEAGVLRTVSPRSFEEDPLRIVRGLRFVSQLGLEPDPETLAQMRENAEGVALVSGERIGGGLADDGMGELSKLLLGSEPRKALRIARDTGVLVAMLPEYGPAIGFDSHSNDHAMTVDEHIFAVVQAAADAGVPLRVRLATLFHDLGKPEPVDGREPCRDRREDRRRKRCVGFAIRTTFASRSSGSSASTRSCSARATRSRRAACSLGTATS